MQTCFCSFGSIFCIDKNEKVSIQTYTVGLFCYKNANLKRGISE